MAPKKITKAQAKKRKLEDILDLEEVTEDPLADLVEEPILNPWACRNWSYWEVARVEWDRQYWAR
jgi:hypothetical protein